MSDISAWVVGQAGALRDAFPDAQPMIVVVDNGNNTYDVRPPGWGENRKLTGITNINPGLVGQIFVDDTVLVGCYDGNPQQRAILSKAGFLLSAEIAQELVDIARGTLDWPTVGLNEWRGRDTVDRGTGWIFPTRLHRLDTVAACAIILNQRVYYFTVDASDTGYWFIAELSATATDEDVSFSRSVVSSGRAIAQHPIQATAVSNGDTFDLYSTWASTE